MVKTVGCGDTDHGEVMLSLDGKARENSGDVIGAAICFSGEYLMNHGLEMPYRHDVDWNKKNDWESRVLALE